MEKQKKRKKGHIREDAQVSLDLPLQNKSLLQPYYMVMLAAAPTSTGKTTTTSNLKNISIDKCKTKEKTYATANCGN